MGFNVSNYDVLPFNFPINGMNQSISPDVLPVSHAYYLENIISNPKGLGKVRYGTKHIFSLSSSFANIIGNFIFNTKNGEVQHIIYFTDFAIDATAKDFVLDPKLKNKISFETDYPSNYIQSLRINLSYNFNGVNRIIDYIDKVKIDENNPKRVIIMLRNNFFPDALSPSNIIKIEKDKGFLGYYSELGGFSLLKENLDPVCIPRSVNLSGLLLICNGVDPVWQWDGVTLSMVKQVCLQNGATNFNRINDYSFSFNVSENFNENHFKTGSLFQITLDGEIYDLTVESYSYIGTLCTIIVSEVLPGFDGKSVSLFYFLIPPAFSYMYSIYSRVWALGPGRAGLKYRTENEAMKVYFSFEAGSSVVTFYNVKTEILPSMNIRETHGVFDNLEAISNVHGHIAFIGRNSMQLWSGTTPDGGAETDENLNKKPMIGSLLRYKITLPVGSVHSDLVSKIGNDIYFISKKGLVSIGNIREQTEQFAVTSHNEMDTLILDRLFLVLSDNLEYLNTRSFKYSGGPFLGFKMGLNNVICSLFDVVLNSWFMFSGDFKKAVSFSSAANMLCLSKKNALYQYADGKDGSLKLYGDNGGEKAVFFSWAIPAVSLKKSNYSNLFYDIDLEYSSSFKANKENDVKVNISGSLPKSCELISDYNFDNIGDVLSTVPLTTKPPIEVSDEDIGFRPYQITERIYQKLKFLARKFWVVISGNAKDGPVLIKGITFYGTFLRRS